MKNRANAEEEGKNKRILSHGEFSRKGHSLWLFIILSAIFLFLQERGYPVFSPDKIKRSCLDNGIVVLLKEDHRQALTSIFLSVYTGNITEEKFKGAGIAHFVEHMLFKGTKKRGVGEVFKEIESYGGTINALTSYDYTGYKITVPSEFTSAALEVLTDMLSNATFNIQELEKERAVVLKEIRLADDEPQKYAEQLLWQTAYSTHFYKYPILGEEDLFNKLTREDLQEFYRCRYTPNNMALAVVGDIDTEKVLGFIKESFKDFLPKSQANFKPQPEPPQNNLRRAEEKFTAGLSYLLLGYHSVALSDQDCFALDVLAAILGEGKSSRLYQLICHKKSLVYNLEAVNYTPREPGLFIIWCLLDEGRLGKTQALIFDQLNKIKQKRVSPGELEKAKHKIISNILFAEQTFEAQAEDLASNETITGNYKFTDEYIEKIKRVDANDILRVANKYLAQNNVNIVTLIPRQKGIKSSSTESRGRRLTIGRENLTRKAEEGAITRFVLDNGLTLLVSENKALPLVSIAVIFKGGLLTEDKNTNGLCNFVSEMLDKGTESKSASAISNLVESKGAHLASFSGNNSFGLTLDLLSQDFDQMLTLLADLMRYPEFPRAEFQKQKRKNLAQLKAEEDDIFAAGMRLLRSTLFQRHPYRFSILGDEQSLGRLKPRQLKKFYRKYGVGRNMVLAIFGDINTQETLAKVKKLFIQLEAGHPAQFTYQPEPKLKIVRQVTKPISKKQSLVLLGFSGTSVFSQDRYTLEIICRLLAQSSGRLFSEIREKAGHAYTLGAYSIAGLDPGYIVIYVATTEENVAMVKQEIWTQLNLLKQRAINREELAQVKRALLGRKLISRQTNANCAWESSLDELYGLGADYYLEYAQKINCATPEDIQRCAQQYFDSTNYALVVLGPENVD